MKKVFLGVIALLMGLFLFTACPSNNESGNQSESSEISGEDEGEDDDDIEFEDEEEADSLNNQG